MKRIERISAVFFSLVFYYVIFLLVSGIENPLHWELKWQIAYFLISFVTCYDIKRFKNKGGLK